MEAALAGLGLAAEVVELIRYLRVVKQALDSVEGDVEDLIRELQSLNRLYDQLEQECKGKSSAPQRDLWDPVRETLDEGRASLKRLDSDLKKAYGSDPKRQGFIDGLRKQHRLREVSSRLRDFREQLHTYNGALQIWLHRVTLANQGSFERDTSQQLQSLRDGMQDLQTFAGYNSGLHSSADTAFARAAAAALDKVNASLKSHEQVSINKIFDIPHSVESCYVGREEESRILAACFLNQAKGRPKQQQRFVIHGVGGSGKTQFCCKFAQDYQHWFWGVFWIDGRSHDHLKQSLSQNVSTVGGVDFNHRAALKWLANQEERWLLIIDNADDPSIELIEYLPKGGRGYVLITTRNPGYQELGNVDPRSFKFQGMKNEDANALLFKTAGLNPSSEDSEEISRFASAIVESLGYLALAITVAGRAIHFGYCKIQTYLQYVDDMLEERRNRRQARRRSAAVPQDAFEETKETKVEATFDVSYMAIASKSSVEARDALQLLNTFAFLHCENVRFDFMKKCIENAQKEEEQRSADKDAAARARATPSSKSWKQWGIELWMRYLTASRGGTLPDVFRDARANRRLNERRLRAAMQELTQYSLATYNTKVDSWSMHPLVHKWAQELLGMRVGEQFLWCEAAATLVCSCVYIGQEDQQLLRQLLPHVDHVRKEHAKLEKRIKDNRMARIKPWPVFESGFSPERALRLAKFSLVYAQNGRWEDAEVLQRVVQRFTVDVLGFEHPNTRRITMALAGTLWYLGRSNESAKLLEQLVTACTKHCGVHDRETLIAKQKMGESLWQQGRVRLATAFFKQALDGFQAHYDKDDDDALSAMDALGIATVLFGTPEALAEARRLHQYTYDARRRLFGAQHLKTLSSREMLCAVACWTGDQQELLDAEEGLTEIIRIRKEVLGPEHAFTLLAMLHCARVKVELEEFDGAEELFVKGLAIGEVNLGKGHMGVLFGHYQHGRMRVREKRWVEARDILVDVTERQKDCLQGWGRYHYDRIGSLVELAKAHNALGEHDACDEAVAEALVGFEKVTEAEHPWSKKLRAEAARWSRERTTVAPT